jgi:hypothetical protein
MCNILNKIELKILYCCLPIALTLGICTVEYDVLNYHLYHLIFFITIYNIYHKFVIEKVILNIYIDYQQAIGNNDTCTKLRNIIARRWFSWSHLFCTSAFLLVYYLYGLCRF